MTTRAAVAGADDPLTHRDYCTDRTIRQSDIGRGWERFRCIGCGAETKRQKATR